MSALICGIRLAASGDCFTQREDSRAILLDRAAILRARRDGELVAERSRLVRAEAGFAGRYQFQTPSR
jgi:hypothetical protein